MRGLTRPLMILSIAVLLLVLGTGAAAFHFLQTAPTTSDEHVVFEVKPDESFKAVARRLEENALITSAWKFNLLARVLRVGGKVRVGEYELRRNFRPREILQVLVSGKSIEHPIMIPEGANIFEIAEILEKSQLIASDDFMELVSDKLFIQEILGRPLSSLEGYLFPETYYVTKFTGARGFVRMMVERFRENYKRVEALPGWDRGTLTDHQMVTLASIIEKETAAPEERPVIASVFYNRLRINMPLQTDPTVIYGLYLQNGTWDGVLPRAELNRPGPYNSYKNLGLPPGPIGNPGFEALKAAGLPEKTDYLFFVSHNDGTHTFSREYGQHASAVRAYWESRRRNDSKSSWRDLKKREKVPDRVLEAPPIAAEPSKKTSLKSQLKNN